MPPVQWPLQNDRPLIEVALPLPGGAEHLVRLVADTGAGTRQSVFQLILAENDCLQGGGIPMGRVQLGGAYSGWFPVYLVGVRISQLNFDEPVPAVGVSRVPPGFDGIAGFKFLNRFHYGNFGNPDSFGLDLLPVP
jgi:hypothetical protein